MQKDDRRKHPRFSVPFPVTIESPHGGSQCLIENISARGAFICCEKPYHIDEVITLTIELPDASPLHLTAKVIWLAYCDNEARPFGMGIRFGSEFYVNH
jgi:Tfp pilus assembly protein PilZ